MGDIRKAIVTEEELDGISEEKGNGILVVRFQSDGEGIGCSMSIHCNVVMLVAAKSAIENSIKEHVLEQVQSACFAKMLKDIMGGKHDAK